MCSPHFQKSLFDYQDEVVAVLEGLRETPEGASSHMAIPSDVVTRGEADRVGTLMRWSAEKGETAICLLNSALPGPYAICLFSGGVTSVLQI